MKSNTPLIALAVATAAALSLPARAAVSVGEHGLWRIRFDDGSTLSERDISTNGVPGASVSETRLPDGRIVRRFSSREAEVAVELSKGGDATDVSATVAILSEKTATQFDFPARLRFPRDTVTRFSYPGRSNWGPGLAFNRKFFSAKNPKSGEWMSYADVRYPTQFADFARAEFQDGSSWAVFGVQPRPQPAGWDNPTPFVPAVTGVGADDTGGWYDHAFGVWLKKGGGVWTSPVVRLVRGGSLRDNLADYAAANGLRKTLAEKVGDEALLERLKCAPLYKCERDAATARRMLAALPAPTLYHTTTYLKGGFDKEYPDHFPVNRELFGTEADFQEVIDLAHTKGHLFCPYTNPTWWCDHPRGPTFVEKGESALLVNPDGTHRYETYSNGKVDGWQVTVRHPDVQEANRRTLAHFVDEFPVDFVFQDQVGGRDWLYDLNPAANGATDMPESYIAMNEEDVRLARLFVEDGWDRIAENNIGLCGCNWWVFPYRHKSGTPRPHFKDEFPADCWEIEPITQYLAHDKCLFYAHNLGAFTDNPELLAWTIACGFQTSAIIRRYETDEAERDWYAWLHLVQRLVISRIAGQPLLSFRHDRSSFLARGGDLARREDDGTIVARWGDADVAVNLGEITREVAGHALAPYGWWITAPGIVSGCPAGGIPFVEAEGVRHELVNGKIVTSTTTPTPTGTHP